MPDVLSVEDYFYFFTKSLYIKPKKFYFQILQLNKLILDNVSGAPKDFVVKDNIAAILDHQPEGISSNVKLILVDLKDIKNPRQIGEFVHPKDRSFLSAFFNQNYAYLISEGKDGYFIDIVDITNPSKMHLVLDYKLKEGRTSPKIFSFNEKIVVISSEFVDIFTLTESTELIFIKSLSLPKGFKPSDKITLFKGMPLIGRAENNLFLLKNLQKPEEAEIYPLFSLTFGNQIRAFNDEIAIVDSSIAPPREKVVLRVEREESESPDSPFYPYYYYYYLANYLFESREREKEIVNDFEFEKYVIYALSEEVVFPLKSGKIKLRIFDLQELSPTFRQHVFEELIISKIPSYAFLEFDGKDKIYVLINNEVRTYLPIKTIK